MSDKKSISDKYSEQLVTRVNELFYDSSNEDYNDEISKEMSETETNRWRNLASIFIVSDSPKKLLDIGTGTGFVPIAISDLLSESNEFVCSDLSNGMLNIAKENISRMKNNCNCKFDFVKINGDTPLKLPFDNSSFDVIMMNSVLHHIKNISNFLEEINRIIKPNGIVIIAHEPNRKFNDNLFLSLIYGLLKIFLLPKLFISEVSQLLGFNQLIKKFITHSIKKKKEIVDSKLISINNKLISESLIDKPLDMNEIAMITDVRDSEGFYPIEIFSNFSLIHLETYQHIHLISIHYIKSKFINLIDKFLKNKFLNDGERFCAVYKKL